jgi:hypothetical protein
MDGMAVLCRWNAFPEATGTWRAGRQHTALSAVILGPERKHMTMEAAIASLGLNACCLVRVLHKLCHRTIAGSIFSSIVL